jgi:hypothetical protein
LITGAAGSLLYTLYWTCFFITIFHRTVSIKKSAKISLKKFLTINYYIKKNITGKISINDFKR